MPELVEVEQFRRLLLPLAAAAEAAPLEVECPSPVPPRTFPTPSELRQLREGRYLVHSVRRRGKLLRLDLRRGGRTAEGAAEASPSSSDAPPPRRLHLDLRMGMTGRISTPDVVPRLESTGGGGPYPPPHTHLVLRCGAAEAAFSDPRRFGGAVLRRPGAGDGDGDGGDGMAGLAPDAMDEPGDPPLGGLAGRGRGVKAVLLDQRDVVSGVGNWIADEVLYRAGIHPDQAHLTETEVAGLAEQLRHVLATAVRCASGGEPFPPDWIFHRRWSRRAGGKGKGKGAVTDAKGRRVSWIQSGGRSSAVVPEVQKLRPRGGSGPRSKRGAGGRRMKDAAAAAAAPDPDGPAEGERRSARKRRRN